MQGGMSLSPIQGVEFRRFGTFEKVGQFQARKLGRSLVMTNLPPTEPTFNQPSQPSTNRANLQPTEPTGRIPCGFTAWVSVVDTFFLRFQNRPKILIHFDVVFLSQSDGVLYGLSKFIGIPGGFLFLNPFDPLSVNGVSVIEMGDVPFFSNSPCKKPLA